MRFSYWCACLVLAAIAASLLNVPQTSAGETLRREVESQRSFDETVEQLKWAIGGHGLTIVTTMNYQEILKKLNVESSPSLVFEVMSRPWAKTMLQIDAAAGLHVPLRIYVFERRDGKTFVAYYQPSALFETEPDSDLNAFAQQLDQTLEEIVRAAARR